ncbi:hypothetical protein TRAPUB_7213 [Trametes pubescens]|uniref:F-box domain-containing protein n=1 Tax=Trametes pubescens TaxID=154538 RepID=A0A1M2W704_TRAPU|nr:hypothetical protein TRAPUB_7213 [Trametes pubescens]
MLATYNPALGAFVDTLDVAMFTPFSSATLWKSIAALPNLTDLILIVPDLRNATALGDITLPQLQYFRTDLPHRMLLGFLQAHPTIGDLDLLDGAHAGALCPLRMVDLSHVQHFSGPSRCISQLAHDGATRLTMELEDDCQGASLPLHTIPSLLPLLYQLTIDIRNDDDDILYNVARAFPGLRKLKLVEKASPTHRPSLARRAWNDTLAWSRALRMLCDLEELLLRTCAPLVRKSANTDAERKVISAWINGTRRASRRTVPKPHPTLYHVGVWYGAGKYGGGCITHWSRLAGGWERIISVIDPDRDHLFL